MAVQNIVPIDNLRGRSMTHSQEREKDRNEEDKECLHAANGPPRFPAERVYSLGPPFNNDQGNCKRKDS